MKNIIGPDVRVLSGPLTIIILTAGFFVFGINLSYDAITKRVENYKTARNMERTLEAKLDILKSVEAGSLERASRLTQILPETNPGSVAISQIRRKSQDHFLELSNINLNSEVHFSDNMTSIEFGFDLTGLNVFDAILMLQELKRIAPINNLEKIEMSIDDDGLVEAKIRSKLFWSPFPKNLPPLTSAVIDLTADENKKLLDLGQYELAEFSELTPLTPSDRESPFN